MNNIQITSTKDYGDMALCNLASINLVEYCKVDDAGRDLICKIAVRGLDNAITNGLCPIPEGTISNELYRHVGIGILGAADALAQDKIVIDEPEAQEWFDKIMEDLSYRVLYQSMLLAKERGSFSLFNETKWAEGLTPVHESRRVFPQAWELTEFSRRFEEDGYLAKWDELGRLIKENGIRFAQNLAIAPTSSSAKAINATESTEPVMGLMYKEEGTQNTITLAPNIKQNMQYYKPAFDCDQDALILNAAVRQKYLDQAQSITLYLGQKHVSSLKELTRLHTKMFNLGCKTAYYVKTNKDLEDECENCAV